VLLEVSGVYARDCLVAVCTQCAAITSIPPQSEARLEDARERAATEP